MTMRMQAMMGMREMDVREMDVPVHGTEAHMAWAGAEDDHTAARRGAAHTWAARAASALALAALACAVQAQPLQAPSTSPAPAASAAAPEAPHERAQVPPQVLALDGHGVLAQGHGLTVRLQDLREAAAEFVSQGEQARFWQTPALLSEMTASLYRQQVLAQQARAQQLTVPVPEGASAVQTNRLLGNAYLAKAAAQRMPSAASVEAYAKGQYKQNAQRYAHGEMFRVSHILVSVKPEVRTEEEARQRAQTAIDRLNQGEAFGALAEAMSDDTNSRKEQGALDYREAKELPADFVAVLNGMTVGERSQQPVRTAAGYHVIWLQDRRDAGSLSYDDLRDRLLSQATAQLLARATRTEWDAALAGYVLNTAQLDQVVDAMRAAP